MTKSIKEIFNSSKKDNYSLTPNANMTKSGCICVSDEADTNSDAPTDEISLDDTASEDSLERGNWGNKCDFLLSCVGYAVGLGNLWRFPYLCMRNGGGAFLIPYFIFLVLCGIPLYFLELAFGQFASRSPLTIWSICPLFTGVGWAMVLVSGLVCIYYNIILAWAFYYIVKSFTTGTLPWATCNNWWNTEHCVERGAAVVNETIAALNAAVNASTDVLMSTTQSSMTEELVAGNITAVVMSNFTTPIKRMTSAEEFWHYNVLQLTEGIEDLGGMRWELAGCLLLAWVTVFFCMFKGIQSTGKVVYVTAIAPFIMLFVFLIRGLTLPGAMNGVRFYLTPDFNRLWDFQVWLEACAQIFYSLGVAYGSLITMASYNKFHHDCYKYALVIPFINCGTSFLAGFAIFSIIGFMASEANLTVEEVITSGPGLAFVAYPEALTKLPISPLWAILFFFMLVIIGLDTQFGMFECLMSGCIDAFPKTLMKRKTWFIGAGSCLMFLLGLPLVTKGGIYLFQIFDWYSATFALITISLLECIVIGWLYGAGRFYQDIEMMIGYKPCIWWSICWRFITPAILLTVLVCTVVNFVEPRYGDYVYPWWAVLLGWVLALISLVPIPVIAIYKIVVTPGTLRERISVLTSPSPEWGPLLKRNRTGPHYSSSNIVINNSKIIQITIDSQEDLIKKPLDSEEVYEEKRALKQEIV